MKSALRMRMAAGPRALPWAERLAQEWLLAGLEVSCEGAGSGEDDWVHIETENGEAESELYLDRRKIDFTGPYVFIGVASKLLEAGAPVDFDRLANQTEVFYDETYLAEPSTPKRQNSWLDLLRWLNRENREAAVVLLWHIAEAYPHDEIFLDDLEDSLLSLRNRRNLRPGSCATKRGG